MSTAATASAVRHVALHRDTYVDSVVQLAGTRAMRQVDGVEWAAAAMATPANLETLETEGFDLAELRSAGANDLFLAIRAGSGEAVTAAQEAAQAAMFAPRACGPAAGERPARTLTEALNRAPDTNVAVISVPGDYAALEAHKALSAGLDVLLFSDNVSIDDEVELKDRANRLGRLVMGPGPAPRCWGTPASVSPTWCGPAGSPWWPPPAPARRRRPAWSTAGAPGCPT